MRLSATGPAAPYFSAVQVEWEGMMLDNAGLTADNTVVATGSSASGQPRWAQAIEIPRTPDALGRQPVQAGKVLLIPASVASAAALRLAYLDPESASGTALTDGPVITGEASTRTQFSCAVVLPDARSVLLVPHHGLNFWTYDLYTGLLTKGAARYNPGTATGVVPAYGGAAVGRDGRVYLSAGHDAAKRMHIYDPATGTVDTTTGPVMPYGSDWLTVDHTGPVLPLPDGDILFLTRRNAVLAAPWRYRPSTGAVTNATVTTSTTGGTMTGAMLTPDATRVIVLYSGLSNKIIMYRLDTSTLYDGFLFPVNPSGTNPWSAIVPLANGRFGLIGNGYRGFGVFDITGDMSWELVGDWSAIGGTAGASSNTAGGISLSSGKVLALPSSNLTVFLSWKPYTTGAVPDGIRKSRYVERK